MKVITIKEFSELAVKDEALKQMLIQMAEEHLSLEEMIVRIREYGYEIREDDSVPEIEELSDEDLENVAGGSESTFLGNTLCRLLVFFGAAETEEWCDS